MEPGEDLVVAGYMGQAGTKELARAFRQSLSWFSESYLREIEEEAAPEVTPHLSEWRNMGVTAAEPAGEGGILKAIWDLSGRYRAGIVFWLKDIPVRQSTIEICERCGCNPYRLFSGNCLVMAAENGGRIVRACREAGIPAAVIGRVKEGIAREIRHGEETGYLGRPVEDELHRVLREGLP